MNLRLTGLALISFGLSVYQQEVKAAVPACRDVDPKTNIVCYTETPFSMRQRDVGGTKKWEFIVERWAPGWIVVDWTIEKDPGSMGTYSWPNGSILSSSGNASLVSETRSEKQRLSELKNEVQGKVMGCYGPACGELQQKSQSIDKEIERLTEIQKAAVSAGGNEKMLFTGTTYVSCSKILGIQNCGGGAKASGKIRVNQRYIGTAQDAVAPTLALISETRTALQRLEVSQAEQKSKQNTEANTTQGLDRPNDNNAPSEQKNKSKHASKNKCAKVLHDAREKCLLKGKSCINKLLAKQNCPALK
jgi:hypothetical protein